MKSRYTLPTSTWIIIPAFNEEKYIPLVLKEVQKYTKNIIVVTDGSTDNTPEISSTFTSYVLKHRINLGKGAALKTGCDFAFDQLGAKAVVLMDSDNQHNPSELQMFQKKLDDGFDMVFGIRELDKKMPLIKRLANASASILIFLLFFRYFSDIPCGYKAFTKRAYKKIRWNARKYEVEMEIAARVAKNQMHSSSVIIQTHYWDYSRGMTLLDTFEMLLSIVYWRISL